MKPLGFVIFVAVHLYCVHLTEGVIPGGQQLADEGDDEVRRAAGFAVREIQRYSGLSCNLVCIDTAKSQVVSGKMHHLTLTISTIAKGKRQKNRCFVKVWVQPWMQPTHKLYQYECSGRLGKILTRN